MGQSRNSHQPSLLRLRAWPGKCFVLAEPNLAAL